MFKFVKRYIKSIIWRYKNRHNLTTLKGDFFPLDKVTVGNMTYGPIHAISFGGSDEGLVIGDYCSIADEVVFLLGGGHSMKTLLTYPFRAKVFNEVETTSKGRIIVQDDVWIGYGATILSGVVLGQGCIVGARALVCKDVPPYAIVAGVPARIIRYRFDNDMRKRLLSVDISKIDKQFSQCEIDLLEEPVSEELLDLLDKKIRQQ